MDYELLSVTKAEDWNAYHSIRKSVLFMDREYNSDHLDEYLPTNYPKLLKYFSRPIGTVRIDFAAHNACILRLVAISTEEQSKGHGRNFYKIIEEYVKSQEVNTLRINSNPKAIGYWQKMGFIKQDWNLNELRGISEDCIQMVKYLI